MLDLNAESLGRLLRHRNELEAGTLPAEVERVEVLPVKLPPPEVAQADVAVPTSPPRPGSGA